MDKCFQDLIFWCCPAAPPGWSRTVRSTSHWGVGGVYRSNIVAYYVSVDRSQDGDADSPTWLEWRREAMRRRTVAADDGSFTLYPRSFEVYHGHTAHWRGDLERSDSWGS